MDNSIQEISMYKTPDGKMFDSQEKAEEHIIECISEEIGPTITNSVKDLRDRMSVFNKLFGNLERARIVQEILNRNLGDHNG